MPRSTRKAKRRIWIFAVLYSHDNFDEPDCHVDAKDLSEAGSFASDAAREYCRNHGLDQINVSMWPYGELDKQLQWTVYANESRFLMKQRKGQTS